MTYGYPIPAPTGTAPRRAATQANDLPHGGSMNNEHSTPINATAGRVIAGGVTHEYQPDPCHLISDTPLPTLRDVESPTFKDLTGLKFGRLSVIGYSATHKGRWVCRCTCGNYVLRKTKTVKGGRGEMCEHCSLLQQAKRKDYTRRTGKFPDLAEFQQ